MSLCERVKAVYNNVSYQCRLLGEVIYPRRCAVCKNEIDTGYFCKACRRNFALGKMLMQLDNLDEVFLCYKYHQELQEALQNVKFAGQKDLLPLLKEEAQLVLEETSELQKILLKYDKEIPHGIAVVVNEYQTREDGVQVVSLDIVCERPNHKAILIGKQGQALK